MSCGAQIIDAQKARLKRELETLQVSLRKVAAEKERADTLACQLRADLADTAVERDAVARRDQQLLQQLRQQVSDLERRLQHAARLGAGPDHPQAGKENQGVEVSSRLTFFLGGGGGGRVSHTMGEVEPLVPSVQTAERACQALQQVCDGLKHSKFCIHTNNAEGKRMRSATTCYARQGHHEDTQVPVPELKEQAPERRPHKGVLAAVKDQQYVVALQARPGHIVDVHRYDRMESPPCNAASHQPMK